MKIAKKPVISMLLTSILILFIFLLMQPLTILHFGENIAMLFPYGKIALEERNLLLIIQALMLLVIIPVYILTFVFSWRYRAHNEKAKYDPDLVDNKLAEYIWWGVPLVMTLIVCALTWIQTYKLDPYKSLSAQGQSKKIQVVALQWNWLFIYPEEKIATLNFVQFPKKTPIHFEITADAPMNSFWIPRLGGQIYAMPRMKTQLHLIADEAGDFRGSSANLSGEGFAGMHFITRASSQEDFQKWIDSSKKTGKVLDWSEYEKLAQPNENHSVEIYQLKDEDLFNQIINKYMHPAKQ